MKTLLVMILPFVLVACSDHKSTVKDFYKAAYAGDSEKLKDILIDQQLSAIEFYKAAANKGEFKGCQTKSIEENKAADVTSVVKSVPNAKEVKEFAVAVECKNEKYKDGKTNMETVWVMKIDGKYKVAVKK